MLKVWRLSALLGAGTIIWIAAGCADRNKNGQPESMATKKELVNAVDSAARKVEGAGQKVAKGTESTAESAPSVIQKFGNSVSSAANKAGEALTEAGEVAAVTSSVKAALAAAPGMKGSEINVDTLVAKKSVALRGTVKTPAQKTLAMRITRQKQPKYKIINQLTIK